jgi:NAD(P)H-dependent FMN reductase
MKIVAFAGSNSRESINKQLAEYAAKQFTGAEVEVLDLNDYEMPMFSVDREKHDGIPTLALRFAEK